jgi:predicted SprT family Zn-dependent metalloprotease
VALADYAEPLSEALLADIQRAFDQSYQLACEKLGYADKVPELRMSLKSRRMAGRAMPQHNVIELNKVIFRNNPQWSFVYDTVAHEMAHIVASRRFRSHAHDARWKAVAETLGATPRASGQFDIANAEVRKPAKGKTYPFICDCQPFDFGPQRLSNFLKGSRYQCRTCKSEIKPDLRDELAFSSIKSPLKRARLKLRAV